MKHRCPTCEKTIFIEEAKLDAWGWVYDWSVCAECEEDVVLIDGEVSTKETFYEQKE